MKYAGLIQDVLSKEKSPIVTVKFQIGFDFSLEGKSKLEWNWKVSEYKEKGADLWDFFPLTSQIAKEQSAKEIAIW